MGSGLSARPSRPVWAVLCAPLQCRPSPLSLAAPPGRCRFPRQQSVPYLGSVSLTTALHPHPPDRGISRSLVTVLGYGLLTSNAHALVGALAQRDFGVVVVDESHYLKSRQAARTRLLVPLIRKAQRAILLTGTPALGRPEEVRQSHLPPTPLFTSYSVMMHCSFYY